MTKRQTEIVTKSPFVPSSDRICCVFDEGGAVMLDVPGILNRMTTWSGLMDDEQLSRILGLPETVVAIWRGTKTIPLDLVVDFAINNDAASLEWIILGVAGERESRSPTTVEVIEQMRRRQNPLSKHFRDVYAERCLEREMRPC
ncbi:helix-turn-helix domain-containing protein [Agrobacterium vitis]|uniref:helix-turn-helix domain-containing protein n=1 Tax=Agrobacterium vitis TaxID=373 RepID=UPI0018D240B0|nr:helix-turn-helix domain-containing protein [Agrobacterium vitis]